MGNQRTRRARRAKAVEIAEQQEQQATTTVALATTINSNHNYANTNTNTNGIDLATPRPNQKRHIATWSPNNYNNTAKKLQNGTAEDKYIKNHKATVAATEALPLDQKRRNKRANPSRNWASFKWPPEILLEIAKYAAVSHTQIDVDAFFGPVVDRGERAFIPGMLLCDRNLYNEGMKYYHRLNEWCIELADFEASKDSLITPWRLSDDSEHAEMLRDKLRAGRVPDEHSSNGYGENDRASTRKKPEPPLSEYEQKLTNLNLKPWTVELGFKLQHEQIQHIVLSGRLDDPWYHSIPILRGFKGPLKSIGFDFGGSDFYGRRLKLPRLRKPASEMLRQLLEAGGVKMAEDVEIWTSQMIRGHDDDEELRDRELDSMANYLATGVVH